MKSLRKFLIGLGMLVIIGAIIGQHTPMAKPADDSPHMASEEKAVRVVKEFPRYQHPVGYTRRNIVIAPDPNLDALVALAKRLHRTDPNSQFMIFTDGNAKQFRRFMLWDIHYAKEDRAQYPYPETWANRHNIASINPVMVSGRWRWRLQLFRGDAVIPAVQYGHAVDLD